MTTIPATKVIPYRTNREPGFLARMLEHLMHPVDEIIIPLQRALGTRRMAYFFVLPNLLIFGIFILLPMALNFYYSFTGSTALQPSERPWVGTDNFSRLLNCGDYGNPVTCDEDIFWRAVWNTGGFVFFQVSGMIVFALVTALTLNRQIKGRGFFRSVFFYPVLLSPVVVGLIWKWILQRDGVLNAGIVALGGEQMNFLVDPNWSRFWVIVVSIWAQMGFYTLILLAGLQSIPHEYYEAAHIDGADTWNRFRFVTFPLLMPTMLVVVVLSLIRAVQVFDQAFALTGGGPGTATTYIVQYIYNTGFTSTSREAGLAAAASVVLGGALLILTVAQLKLGRRTEANH